LKNPQIITIDTVLGTVMTAFRAIRKPKTKIWIFVVRTSEGKE
jgi:hypothetical protein